MDLNFGCDCALRYQAPQLANFCGQGNVTPYIVFMGIVELYLRLRCDIEDPCRRVPSKPITRSSFDFIVIGSGPAGCAVASRLSEIPNFQVLLIEAGDLPPTYTRVPAFYPSSIFGRMDYKFFGAPQTNCFGSSGGAPFFPRGMMLGGTACMNAMNYQRGAREDYDNMNKDFNLKHWSFQDCLYYFMKSENNQNADVLDEGYHKVGGPQTVSLPNYLPPLGPDIIQGAVEMGYPIIDSNGHSHYGFTVGQLFASEGKRMSPVEAFIKPFIGRNNLQILMNATVTKVNLDGNKAVSVDILYNDGRTDTLTANLEIILSGGTILSPQLLQVSGIGPKDVLEKAGVTVKVELPGVGENMHDHVRSLLLFSIDEIGTSTLSYATLLHYWATGGGPISVTGIHPIIGFVNTKYATQKYPDGQIMFQGYLPSCSKTGSTGELESSAGADGKRHITIWPVNVQTKSRGKISITSADYSVHPLIEGRYLSNDDDVKVLIEIMKLALKLVTMPALQKYNFTLIKNAVGCEKFDIQTQADQYLECHARFHTSIENHMVGTCRMGDESDKMAVVDPNLKVIGVSNLRVCDASVLPRVPTSNTEAPTMMVGERCADFIKDTWARNGNPCNNGNSGSGNGYGWGGTGNNAFGRGYY